VMRGFIEDLLGIVNYAPDPKDKKDYW